MTSAEMVLVLTTVISAATAVFVVLQQTRKHKSDIAVSISEAWEKLNKPLLERIESLERRDGIFRQREMIFWNYINDLRELLQEHDIKAPDLPMLPDLEAKQK